MTEDTSAYWRKLLKLDEKEERDITKEFDYPHRILRPLLYLIFRFLSTFYFRLKAFGLENLPDRPPYIIAANHVSSADFHCAAYSLPKKARDDLYVLVTKLFYDIAFTRFVIKAATSAARIDTMDDFMPALRVAASLLRHGKSVYMNPEGTRSGTGEILPFRPGVGVLAVEMGVPIVPVYVDGTLDLLPMGSIFPRPFKKVNVYFGKPVDMAPYQEKKKTESAYYVYKEATEEVRDRMVELQKTAKAKGDD